MKKKRGEEKRKRKKKKKKGMENRVLYGNYDFVWNTMD